MLVAMFVDFQLAFKFLLRMGILEEQDVVVLGSSCPFQPSFRSLGYIKWTLPTLAATPLKKNRCGWISCTTCMSFGWHFISLAI